MEVKRKNVGYVEGERGRPLDDGCRIAGREVLAGVCFLNNKVAGHEVGHTRVFQHTARSKDFFSNYFFQISFNFPNYTWEHNFNILLFHVFCPYIKLWF